MKAEQLRKAILQMAIQGKLVPQDPNDEPASVLLEKIRAEKQRLIKEGKIKKDKLDSVIIKGEDNRHYEKVGNNAPVCIEDDLPFEIPDSWAWSKISNISFPVGTRENQILTSEILKDGAIPVVSQSQNLIDGYTNYKEKQISTLPLIMFGDHTKVVKYIDFPFVIGADGTKFHKAIFVYPKYLYLLISHYASQIPSRGYARHYSLLKTQFLPIPPLAEQQRIVAEIEKYEPLIVEYDKLEQQKTKLDSEIYDKLKKSILQYAIQGKLVPQDENDEPASVLLEKIRAEKKAKLGKKYVDSYIYKGDDNCYYEKVGNSESVLLDNLPFEIPDSWCWARFGNAVSINPRNSIDDKTLISFVEMKSLKDGFNNDFTYEPRYWREVKSGFTHFQDNDVGFAKITPCFQNRKSCVFHHLKNSYGAGTTELHILRAFPNIILSEYLLWFVKSPYFIEYGKQNFSGTAGQQRFGTNEMKNTFVPIPPYREQIRIVIKINSMLQIFEKDEV